MATKTLNEMSKEERIELYKTKSWLLSIEELGFKKPPTRDIDIEEVRKAFANAPTEILHRIMKEIKGYGDAGENYLISTMLIDPIYDDILKNIKKLNASQKIKLKDYVNSLSL